MAVGVGRLAMAATAAIGALYAAGLLYEIDLAPAGCCGLTWPSPNPQVADRLLPATDPKGVNAAEQWRAGLQVLAARPADSQAWLRLAYADRLQHGRLTEFGAHAVEMSYLAVPFVWRQAPWRIRFALDNWSRLTPEGRKYAIKEVAAVQTDPQQILDARKSIGRPADPSGRLAAALVGLN